MKGNTYIRKISAEEAREGFVFITKDALTFFPPVGEELALAGPEGVANARLVAAPCECVGPPHEHYHLVGRLPVDLVKGGVVRIQRTSAALYECTLAQPSAAKG